MKCKLLKTKVQKQKNMRGTKFQLFVTGGSPFKSMFEPSTELESELFRTIQVLWKEMTVYLILTS